MPLNTRTELQILSDSKELLSQKGIVVTGPGSTAGALLEIASSQLAGVHRQIEAMHADLYLSTAAGTALDRLGVLLGTPRGLASRAYDTFQNVRFRIEPATGETARSLVKNRGNDGITTTVTQDITPSAADPITLQGFFIKEGTTLTGINNAKYVTTTAAVFTEADTEEYVSVIAVSAGSLSNVPTNGLTTHDIKTSQTDLASIADYILVDNRMPISSGQNTESDENYRFRLQQSILSLQTGNQSALLADILSVPGVRNATFLPYLRGVGTFTVLIESSHPVVSDGIVHAVQQVANISAAAGNRAIIIRPDYKVITAKVALQYRPGADRARIRQQARRNAVNYINEIPVGDTFILNEFIQRIMDTDEKLLDFQIRLFQVGKYNPSGGSAGTVTNVETIPGNKVSNLSPSSRTERWYASDRFITICDF